jgi:hypothetical protein
MHLKNMSLDLQFRVHYNNLMNFRSLQLFLCLSLYAIFVFIENFLFSADFREADEWNLSSVT